MRISNLTDYIKAHVEVQVEGFFCERFLNLCKTNNISLIKVTQVDVGVLKIILTPKEYRKIKKYIKKTKCKMKIINKKGIYFDIFRYRKRRLALLLCALCIIAGYVFSTFIWKIEIVGNSVVKNEEIIKLLEDRGVKKGTSSFFVEKFKTADYIRANIYEIAWVGLQIKGTTLEVEIVEKYISTVHEDMNKKGDIISSKKAVITKIVAEDGTARVKIDDTIQEGTLLIEGAIYSNDTILKQVHARGIARGVIEYIFDKKYNYITTTKVYEGKNKYGVGIGIKNKEYLLKYLPNHVKYDINRNVKNIDLFGLNLSFITNTYTPYKEEKVNYTEDEIAEHARLDMIEFEQSLLINTNEIKSKTTKTTKLNDGVVYNVKYLVEEDVGRFVSKE